MRVVVFALAPLWSPHFETELELVAKHESQGDEVVIVACRGALESCVANPYHRELDCIACRSKCNSGLAAIGRRADSLETVEEWISGRDEKVHERVQFDSIEDLRGFARDGVAIGRGAASSFISILRDSHPAMDKHQDLTERLLESGRQMTEVARRAIRQHDPDLVYVFNGRFATSVPVVDVCRLLGVSVKTHDASYVKGRYRLVESETVHDLDSLKREMLELWALAGVEDPNRDKKAREFFEHRRYGGEASGHRHLDFKTSQVSDYIRDFEPRRYVAILNSSEDEFATLSQYANPVYENQMAALEAIVDEPRLSGVRFALRVHPNLKGLHNEQMRHIASLSTRSNLTIIPADDPVDTYALIENAACVVTFGSRAGVEAVYWRTPSILVGRALHEDLGIYKATSHDQVVTSILKPPSPAPVEGALPYGYFLRESGNEFRHYEQFEYYTGRVNGKIVRPNLFIRTVRRARNLYRLAASMLLSSDTDNRTVSQR